MASENIIKRFGNNIGIKINVISIGANVNLLTDLGYVPDYEISLHKVYGRTYNVPKDDITASLVDGTFSFVWKASKQYGIGDYTLVLRLFNDEDGNTIDRTQAIRLTKHTCQGTTTDSNLIINFEL